MKAKRSNFPIWLGLLVSAIVLSVVGIYNGYPLFYSDTNAYILSGMHLDTPTTRPMTYGLFILIASLGSISLWPVILVQTWIVAYLIHCCVRDVLKMKNTVMPTVLISTALVLTTGVSWVSSELIADIFTPITILSLILLLVVKDLSKSTVWLLFLIFFLSNATHISHMAISAVLIVTVICFRKRISLERAPVMRRIGISLLLMIIGYFTMSSSVAKSRHIFLMAHLNEIGVLKPYLDAECPHEHYSLCKYKESIPRNFIWDKERSPIYQEDIGWTTSQDEFDRIITDILTTPQYLSIVLSTLAKGTVQQLYSFRVGNGNYPYREDSEMYETIQSFFPNEAQQYLRSKQNQETLLPVPLLDKFHLAITSLAVILIIVCMIKWRRLGVSRELRSITVLVFVGIVVNAVVCVAIVSVVDRFGCRVMWLLPMLSMLYVLAYLQALPSTVPPNGSS